jgi:putative tryptophan/tyrosine transport system substrate-binding protein
MMRREFIAAICSAAVARPIVALGQQTGKVYRVGLISAAAPVSDIAGPEPFHPPTRAFLRGLRALGYVEGHNLILERRSAEGRYERSGDIVTELVRLNVDVIVTVGAPMALAAKAVTTTVPIVMATSKDPETQGLVQSLAQPGGNITGLSTSVGPDLEAKRLALLREVLPGLSRVAYLSSKADQDWERPWGKSVRMAAEALGVTLVLAEHTAREYADAFALLRRANVDALFVSWSPPAFADRAQIVDFATRTRLPTNFAYREPVELGGLMSYGVNVADLFRRAAGYVDKILQGAKPADLPVDRPTKFEFVINLKTAKTLGLTVPPTLLAQADEVIE